VGGKKRRTQEKGTERPQIEHRSPGEGTYSLNRQAEKKGGEGGKNENIKKGLKEKGGG